MNKINKHTFEINQIYENDENDTVDISEISTDDINQTYDDNSPWIFPRKLYADPPSPPKVAKTQKDAQCPKTCFNFFY